MNRNIFMRKTLLLVFSLLLLTSCSNSKNDTTLIDPSSTDLTAVTNPFEDNAQVEILGELGHSLNNVICDEYDNPIPVEYNGGTLQLDYQVTASGTAKNVGFLLFLDGIPQPWQMNNSGDSSCMQYLTLENDDESYPFTISFLPVTGQIGDTLVLTVCSIYNPQFQPDMVSTSAFGQYHSELSNTINIHFNAVPSSNNALLPTKQALNSVNITSVKMTDAFVDSQLMPNYGSDGETKDEMLENNVYSFILYDGREEFNYLDIAGQEKVHITYQLCGIPGGSWRIALYGNHELLSDGTDSNWQVTLKKGEIATLEADVEVRQLDKMTTFYVVACPVSDNKYFPTKSKSILFYQ